MGDESLSASLSMRSVSPAGTDSTGLPIPDFVPDAVPERRVSTPAELTAAREDAGLSQQQLARSLRLDVRQIIALELGEYDRLPGRAFVHGALRAIARAVHIDASPLLATVGGSGPMVGLLGQIKPMAAVPVAAAGAWGNYRHHASDGRGSWRAMVVPGAFVGGIALVGLALIGGLGQNGPNNVTASTIVQVPVPGVSSVKNFRASSPQAPLARTQPAIRSDIKPLPVGHQAAAVGTPKRMPTGLGTGLARKQLSASDEGTAKKLVFPVKKPELEVVQLSFTKPTWVDIRHKDGEKLLYGTQKAAKLLSVRGVAPMQVVIGNPDGVKMTFRGEAVDLRGRSRKGVSRFILN